LNPMKHKIVIEIPPYYIDTLVQWKCALTRLKYVYLVITRE
jgi:hypothetical protein